MKLKVIIFNLDVRIRQAERKERGMMGNCMLSAIPISCVNVPQSIW